MVKTSRAVLVMWAEGVFLLPRTGQRPPVLVLLEHLPTHWFLPMVSGRFHSTGAELNNCKGDGMICRVKYLLSSPLEKKCANDCPTGRLSREVPSAVRRLLGELGIKELLVGSPL